jgi:hypothetical protein
MMRETDRRARNEGKREKVRETERDEKKIERLRV